MIIDSPQVLKTWFADIVSKVQSCHYFVATTVKKVHFADKHPPATESPPVPHTKAVVGASTFKPPWKAKVADLKNNPHRYPFLWTC